MEERLEGLGEAVKRRLGGQARFVDGFVLASLVACVGPLAVLGDFVLSRLGRGRLGARPCSSTRAA